MITESAFFDRKILLMVSRSRRCSITAFLLGRSRGTRQIFLEWNTRQWCALPDRRRVVGYHSWWYTIAATVRSIYRILRTPSRRLYRSRIVWNALRTMWVTPARVNVRIGGKTEVNISGARNDGLP
jgi:hypothetical protein